jgi:hypothetical protein
MSGPDTASEAQLRQLLEGLAQWRTAEQEIDARVGRVAETVERVATELATVGAKVGDLWDHHRTQQITEQVLAHEAKAIRDSPRRLDAVESRLETLDRAMVASPSQDSRPRIWESEQGRGTILTVGKIAVVVAALAFAPQLALTMWDRAVGTQTVRIEAPAPAPVGPLAD